VVALCSGDTLDGPAAEVSGPPQDRDAQRNFLAQPHAEARLPPTARPPHPHHPPRAFRAGDDSWGCPLQVLLTRLLECLMHALALAADAAAPLFAPARPHSAGAAAPPPGLGFPPARRGALLLPAAGALRALRAHLGVPRLAACAPRRAPSCPAAPRRAPPRPAAPCPPALRPEAGAPRSATELGTRSGPVAERPRPRRARHTASRGVTPSPPRRRLCRSLAPGPLAYAASFAFLPPEARDAPQVAPGPAPTRARARATNPRIARRNPFQLAGLRAALDALVREVAAAAEREARVRGAATAPPRPRRGGCAASGALHTEAGPGSVLRRTRRWRACRGRRRQPRRRRDGDPRGVPGPAHAGATAAPRPLRAILTAHPV
jgi:hypothetical protein